jgi:uncharacterized membrane protein
MNRRDQELLDKQLRGHYVAPRHDGVLALAIVGVFLAGMTAGGFLYVFTDQPAYQVASNDAIPGAPPHAALTVRQ